VPQDSLPPNSFNSTDSKSWQYVVSVLALGFEIICCILAKATGNIFLVWIGVGGAILFALFFFHQQIREKYLEYQGQNGDTSARKGEILVPEESLLLWLMVILLAAIAFISLDLATHTAFSLLAIPFSIAGGIWSYRRRYLAGHWLTHLVFGVAVVMVVACLSGAFWGQTIEKAKHFLGTDKDLVLPLALSLLLVAAQTVRMWSLCYKNALSSSVVLSAMLMASALTLGNNLGFLLALAVFMGLLVPTLMLFYRSALKLRPVGVSIVPRPHQLTERHVPWQYLTKITVVVLVLGCTLSLFAPHLRLPPVSWNFPGLDKLVEILPIKTDPTLTADPVNSSTDGENGGSAENPDTANPGGGQQNPVTGQPQQFDDEAVYLEEQLAQQAIDNILATADRPLTTRAERIAYVTKYLQEHVRYTDCQINSLKCWQKFRSEQQLNGLALVQQEVQIPLHSYYVAQQSPPAKQSSPLLQRLTVPCPVDRPNCYKDRVFQADQQEMSNTRNRLLRSIVGTNGSGGNPGGQGFDQGNGSNGNSGSQGFGQGNGSGGNPGGLGFGQGNGSNKNPDGQGLSQGNGSSGNPGGLGFNQGNGSSGNPRGLGLGQGNGSNGNPRGLGLGQGNGANGNPRGQGFGQGNGAKENPPGNGQNKDDRQNIPGKKNSGQRSATNNPERQKSTPKPAKPPSINSEYLMNFLRVAVVLTLMISLIIWYLRSQKSHDKILKQKEQKFNQKPLVERVYWLMIKELRASGRTKRKNETEWEFVLASNPQYSGLLGKLIAEISADYIAWHYGRKSPNETSLTKKFDRFRELHGAELAKHPAANNLLTSSKSPLRPVK
jgi:hypothetical protein